MRSAPASPARTSRAASTTTPLLKRATASAPRPNRSGGVQGGITNGEDIIFRVGFKPVATIAQKQQTVSVTGEAAELKARGRHDPCVLPRAVPMVEAMTRLVLIDHWLRQRAIGL